MRRDAPPPEDALDALGAMVRRGVGGGASVIEHERGREKLLAALRDRRKTRRRPLGWLAAAALAMAITAVLWISFSRPPLRFAIDGARGSVGGYVHAPPEGAGVTARFSDGSEIAFAAGSSGRIAEVGPKGARVLLESGRAVVHVAHLPGARWSVEAGPFAITVIGTVFDVAWSAEAETLEVRLHEGEVSVRGPLSPGGIDLRAGQRLTARVAEGEIKIDADATEGTASPATAIPTATAMASDLPSASPLAPDPSAIASAAIAPSAIASAAIGAPAIGSAALGAPAVAPAAPSSSSFAAPATPPSSLAAAIAPSAIASAAPPPPSPLPAIRRASSWPKKVAAGDFKRVVAEAEDRGIDETLGEVGLGDLVALADAARYAGKSDLARRAMLAQRSRFPTSAEAHAAAFLLGRLADDGGTAKAEAIRWYDRYLAESPQGAFAAEALGRKMSALFRSRDPSAQKVAAEYLRLYPEGPYAPAAREIAQAR